MIKAEGKIRVIQNGLGAVGSVVTRIMAARENLSIVGALASRSEKVGNDLGEVVGLGRKLGVKVSDDPDALFSETVADIVVDATHCYAAEVYPVMAKALKAKLNFASVSEELAYPWVHSSEIANSIDKLAKHNGVTVMATGACPGFQTEALPVFLAGACAELKKVGVRRVVSQTGLVSSSTIMANFGIGLTREEFQEKQRNGKVMGHVGTSESIALIADAIGWQVEISEECEPLIAKVRRDFSPYLVVEPGQVYAVKSVGRGLKNGEEVIYLEIIGGVGYYPDKEGVAEGAEIWLEGNPSIKVKIDGITSGPAAAVLTPARLVNSIPYVVNARPGLLAVTDVGVITYHP